MVKIRQYDITGRAKIRDYLKDCEHLADLGCNKEKIFKRAIGFDNDLEVMPDIYFDFDKSLEFVSDPTYNGICMSHFLEHMKDTRGILKQCFKALKKGGRIALICPDGETVPSNSLGDSSNTHEQLFTPITLKLYLENAGFKNVHTEYYDRPKAYKQTKGIFGCGEK